MNLQALTNPTPNTMTTMNPPPLLASRTSAPALKPIESLTLGSRNSRLAIIQSELVVTALKAFRPDLNLTILGMSTTGDKNTTTPLHLIGGKALWTHELDIALAQGQVDLVVHSLKDVPTTLPEGTEIAAIMEREDPRDVLVVKSGLPFKTLQDLPEGSVIGTSSVRRIAQLRRRFPHLAFRDMRGNLNTRLAKLDAPDSPYAGLILAAAGLIRLDLASRISSHLAPPILYHAVGQGSLGIQIRTNAPLDGDGITVHMVDQEHRERIEQVKACVKLLDHRETAWRCEAERALLRTLEGGCSVPVGVSSRLITSAPSLSPSLIDPSVSVPSTTSTGGVKPHTIATATTNSVGSPAGAVARDDVGSTPTPASHLPSKTAPVYVGDGTVKPTTSSSPASASSTSPSWSGTLELEAVVTSLDGSHEVYGSKSSLVTCRQDAVGLGEALAHEMMEKGARSILEALGKMKQTMASTTTASA